MIFIEEIYSQPLTLIGIIVGMLIAISFHEFFHAWLANYLGDPTAKNQGRVTINPLKHLDFAGTLFLVLAGFGWGKPVPVNPNNFENGKWDHLWVSLSGPLSNLLLAFIFALPYRYVLASGMDIQVLTEPFFIILNYVVEINIILAVFNLLPIPPLDGASILDIVLPQSASEAIRKIGPPILFILVFLELSSININFFSTIFEPIFQTLSHIVRTFPG